jgi:hypothetical protein
MREYLILLIVFENKIMNNLKKYQKYKKIKK